MLSYISSERMKKFLLIFLLFSPLFICSCMGPKKPPYPSGIIFPLEKAAEVSYDGEIIDFIQKESDKIYFSTRKGFIYCIDGKKAESLLSPGRAKLPLIYPIYVPNLKGLVSSVKYIWPGVLWYFKASEPLESPPYLSETNIFVYDDKNSLYCLDRKGELRWKSQIEEEITSGIIEHQNKIYLGTEKGSFFTINAANGERALLGQAGDAVRSNPVTSEGTVIFGCDDHHLYFLSKNGLQIDKFKVGDKIQNNLILDRKNLYFGTEDHFLYCFNLKSRRVKWKVKIGGKIAVPPVFDKNKIFFLCWNSVLYCLDKKSGTILWWKPIPSRSYYHLEIIEKRIVVSSFSSLLVCFDIKSGERVGNFNASLEIKSNPLWLEPYLLINLYDQQDERGRLQFMKKAVNVSITPSKEFPLKRNEEIVFSSESTGFHFPEYEFYLTPLTKVRFYLSSFIFMKEEKEKKIVQEKSEKKTWAWFPEQKGSYVVGVKAIDEKEKAETEIPLVITGAENIRSKWWSNHLDSIKSSLFKNLLWHSAGPRVMGGRITDVAVPKGSRSVIYAASASGGVWKTINKGTTWESIFDTASALSIGDISVSHSNPEILWVGTGESNSSRSSYAGMGVYKSVNGGKAWENMGLYDSHHIGRVIIHPENPDIVYVAAMGHLYEQNDERGLFKTLDGGRTWEKILSIDEDTGVIDVVMDPTDPNTLYAASWQRSRKAWDFEGSGNGSGIHKTTDGGTTWKPLAFGFPTSEYVGRIGLDIAASNPNVIYAIVDNQRERQKAESDEERKNNASEISIKEIEGMSKKDFLKLDKKEIQQLLDAHEAFPRVPVAWIVDKVKKEEWTPRLFAHTLVDASQWLYETNAVGPEIYRSADKGETWNKVNRDSLDGFYNTYGYYFGQIRVDPKDENKVYILGVDLMVSEDGGKTFVSRGGRGVHSNHHALWIDPDYVDRLIDGNDGGLNFSYDGGKNWQKINNIPLGQFYTVTYDLEEPYNILGGLQSDGVYYGPHTWTYEVSSPWRKILSGVGAYVQVDPVETEVLYAEYQFGNVFRINKKEGSQKNIKPQINFDDIPIRFNWQTPILISPHNRFIIYLGANKLFKSYDRGDHWYPISPDLTAKPEQGDIPFGCIVAISESPVIPGLIYAGTDDGNLWITKNGGATWELVNEGLISNKWISCVVASRFAEGTVYVSLNGFRDDDFGKYLYKSVDYGKTWTSLAANLPAGPVNVIREDPKINSILYAGTDMGVYVSTDSGQNWSVLGPGFPTFYVHDIAVHPRDNDIIVATHGRSVYVMDVEMIQEFDATVQANKVHLFSIKPVFLSKNLREAVPEAKIYFYLQKKAEDLIREVEEQTELAEEQEEKVKEQKEKTTKKKEKDLKEKTIEQKLKEGVTVSIIDKAGKVIKEIQGTEEAGINMVTWDLIVEGKGLRIQRASPGEYRIELKVGDLKVEGTLRIKNRLRTTNIRR